MAWRSSGSTNAALISNLANHNLIRCDRVINAMLSVDRAHFAPVAPYEDSPQGIGHGATISAPHMHASALESLVLQSSRPGARVLDVGSGSGYLTAVFAALGGDGQRVVGIDHIQSLVDLANGNMAKSEQGRRWLEEGRVQFVKGDGRLGYDDPEWRKKGDSASSEEQWDAIHVGAAAKEAHEPLIRQLKRPGRLFIPVGDYTQYIWVFDKDQNGQVTKRKEIGVRYVPLTDAPS